MVDKNTLLAEDSQPPQSSFKALQNQQLTQQSVTHFQDSLGCFTDQINGLERFETMMNPVER